jgi:hypothetical protein
VDDASNPSGVQDDDEDDDYVDRDEDTRRRRGSGTKTGAEDDDGRNLVPPTGTRNVLVVPRQKPT